MMADLQCYYAPRWLGHHFHGQKVNLPISSIPNR